MRNIKIIVWFLFLCGISLAQKKEVVVIETNYDMPAFDNPSAILIDMNNIQGKQSSFVRMTNYSKFRDVEFEIFVHSPLSSSWESLGKNKLQGFDSEVNFGKKYPNLAQYRYFAIVPKNVNKDELQFKMEKKGGKLNVFLFHIGQDIYAEPLPYHEAPNAYVFNKDLLPSDADENIKLINRTSNSVVSVTIFGWDKKKFRWIKLCSVATQVKKGKIKPTLYEVEKLSFTKFKYLALLASDQKQYDYSFQESHDDWIIIVQETY